MARLNDFREFVSGARDVVTTNRASERRAMAKVVLDCQKGVLDGVIGALNAVDAALRMRSGGKERGR